MGLKGLGDAGGAFPPPLTETTSNMISRASRVSFRPIAVAASGTLAALALALPGAAAGAAPTNCDKVAAPGGSDSAPGTLAAPLRTVQALSDALAPGQVGCLRAGSYAGGLRVNHGGAAGAPLVLRSYPGETAQITGRIYVPRGSNYVTVADLSLDGNYQTGRPLPSPNIAANHTTFESDDVTDDHTEICFDIGSESYGVADSTVIVGNRIHDCGLLPSRNEDHGIYIQDATNTQIVGNVIDHNADRGIQFYPSAQGSVVVDNVIADNGEGIEFGGDDGVASSNNTVEHNLIVNSNIRGDVESWYPAGNPHGVNNIVQSNCVSTRGISTFSGGFTPRSNVTAPASELVAIGEGEYLPATGSACASMVPELPSRPGVERAPSGGAPNIVGKAQGVGDTPAPTPASTVDAPTAPADAQHGSPAHGTAHATRTRHAAATKKHHKRARKHGRAKHKKRSAR